MTNRRIWTRTWVAWLLLGSGCGHGAASGASQVSDQAAESTTSGDPSPLPALVPQPVPADLVADIERARRLGRMLYVYDEVGAMGTDAAAEGRDLSALGVGGYLALQEGDESGPSGYWRVVFYTAEKPPHELLQVRLHPKQPWTVERFDPPRAVSPDLALLIRARKTAIDSLDAIEQPLNPVVLPGSAIDEDGILVYLIAGTTKPREAVFGRHHRILMSLDGTRVLRAEALSKTALVLPLDTPEATAVEGLVVSHITSSTPIETHVLVSLQHKIPVMVVTDRGYWQVHDDAITFLGAQGPGFRGQFSENHP